MNVYPIIILVHPQLGENIGACARAMKNFGFYNLRIVEPRDGWPNEKAISASVGAKDIIENAVIYPNLEKATNDLEILFATTGVKRGMNKDYVLTKNLAAEFPFEAKTGIMFGKENWGLSNEEVALANKIITIDTDPNFTSLNLAQAVLIVCYELFQKIERDDLSNMQSLATKQEFNYMLEHMFSALDKTDFFKLPDKREHMTRNIQNIFTRIDKLSHNEVQTLRGIISSLDNLGK